MRRKLPRNANWMSPLRLFLNCTTIQLPRNAKLDEPFEVVSELYNHLIAKKCQIGWALWACSDPMYNVCALYSATIKLWNILVRIDNPCLPSYASRNCREMPSWMSPLGLLFLSNLCELCNHLVVEHIGKN